MFDLKRGIRFFEFLRIVRNFLILTSVEYNIGEAARDYCISKIYISCTEKRRWTIRTNFSFSFSMTTEGCTRVISRAEVEEVVQGCTIHTGAPGVFPASITVHTSGVWGLHTLSIHRPHHSHPNTFSRRRPRLQHPRYPMSTNETRTRSTGEFISVLLTSSSSFLRQY